MKIEVLTEEVSVSGLLSIFTKKQLALCVNPHDVYRWVNIVKCGHLCRYTDSLCCSCDGEAKDLQCNICKERL